MKLDKKSSSNNKFHNISITICPVCGFSDRASTISIKRQKKKRTCPQCGYRFTAPELLHRKFDIKTF